MGSGDAPTLAPHVCSETPPVCLTLSPHPVAACLQFVLLLTTILVTLVFHCVWEMHIALSSLFFVFFGTLEGLYLSANSQKVEAGWQGAPRTWRGASKGTFFFFLLS